MIKKRTALLFILLANIVLLTHAVVPHHHHHHCDSELCISSSKVQAECKTHEHNITEQNHNHDGHENTDCCVLRQAVMISANTIRQDRNDVDCTNNQSAVDGFQAVLFYNGLKAFVPICVSYAHFPFTTSSYTQFSVTSLGLRAPPTV